MAWYNFFSSSSPIPVPAVAPTPSSAIIPPVSAPTPTPQTSNLLTPAALDLILNFEVGDSTGGYYNKFLTHPELPGGDSGITIAIGYDLSTVSQAKYSADWGGKIDSVDFSLLQGAVAISRASSKNYFPKVKSVTIDYQTALEVFQNCDVHDIYNQCLNAFPNFTSLAPNCQGAIMSLVFNRGSKTTPGYAGDTRRLEMANIKNLIPNQDYVGIANQIRHMERLWIGTEIEDGMTRRREAEAALVMTCVS